MNDSVDFIITDPPYPEEFLPVWRDKAEALRLYMKQAGESLDMQNAVAEIKLRAERRAGELLKVMPKQDGGDAARTRSRAVTEFMPPTLEQIGLTKMQSSRFQAVASLPEEVFEQYIEDVKCAESP